MRHLGSHAVLDALDVSRETTNMLKEYLNTLLLWSTKINLVGPGTLADPWHRHILDSAQLILKAPDASQNWCDLGSGAGLPGLVIAILLRERSPSTNVTLIESDARKAAFLKLIIRQFGLRAVVVRERIERASSVHAEIVTARALAPLPQLLGYVFRHIEWNGIALLPKGRGFKEEVEKAQILWHFNLDICESLITSETRILRISHLQPRTEAK